MKTSMTIIASVILLSLSSPTFSADKPAEEKKGPVIKEVCKSKKDKAGKEVLDKNGKAVQECKKIKVHKKLEGKEVPGQKK